MRVAPHWIRILGVIHHILGALAFVGAAASRGRLSRRRYSCAGGRPWVLKMDPQRERGEEELYPWRFDPIESEGARVFPEAQLREWAHSQARRRYWGITPKGVVLGEPWFVLGE
jgi:hypothetical protein